MSEVTIGKRIAAMRKARGWTQAQFAERVKINPSYVPLVELGYRKPGTNLCVKIADAFGISLDELVRGADPNAQSDQDTATDAPAAVLSGAA